MNLVHLFILCLAVLHVTTDAFSSYPKDTVMKLVYIKKQSRLLSYQVQFPNSVLQHVGAVSQL